MKSSKESIPRWFVNEWYFKQFSASFNSFQHFLHHWTVFTGKSLNCEIFQSLSIRAKLTSGKNQFNVTLLFKHLFMLVWKFAIAIAIALPVRLLFTVSIDFFVHIVRLCFLDFFLSFSLSLRFLVFNGCLSFY